MKPVRLTLPYPVSANRYWRTRVIRSKATGQYMAMTYLSAEAHAYKAEIREIAKLYGIVKPFDWRIDITIDLYPNRPQDWKMRQRKNGEFWDDTVKCIDLGNCEKVLGDALQGIIYENDKWVWSMNLRRMEPDEMDGRIEMAIAPRKAVTLQPSLLGGV